MSPTSQITLYLLTLNCARLPQAPSHLTASVVPTLPSTPPTLLLLSLQEIASLAPSFLGGTWITPHIASISSSISSATQNVYDVEYSLVGFHTIGLTAVLAFIHPLAADDISDIKWAGVGLGIGGMGNKGGVAVRMSLGDTEITAVGVHFAPHEFAAESRDKDWETTVRNLVFDDGSQIYPSRPGGHLFVFGDLNYRTADTRPRRVGEGIPSSTAPREEWRKSLEADQLTRRRKAGTTCHFLEEAAIAFPPTYKYDLEAPVSEVEEVFVEKRWPSWTDRILFLPSSRLKVQTYDSIPGYRGSDHKPVFAVFKVRAGGRGDDEAVVQAPWCVDDGWKLRRAMARRGEYVVGGAMMAVESAGIWGVLLTVVLVGWGGWWALSRTGTEI